MTNKLESAAHVAMGLFAAIVNLQLLLVRREWKQLPPANDRHPVLYAKFSPQQFHYTDRWHLVERGQGGDEYFSKARTMDTLRDSREYVIGQTLAYLVLIGIGVLIGRWVW